ncbi:MAG: diguanylate cyclase [Sulfuricellaceae bacterium]|nr:diguanylate cyclase [Sulfuricellaceae bacterium]
MISVTTEELKSILATIEEALSLHDKWREELLRTLVCKLPPAAKDIAEDAHHQCAFGRWFYSKGNSHLRNLPTLKKVGELHQAMHKNAREVCLKVKGTGLVATEDYDLYLGSASQFRDELANVRLRVSHTLQNIDSLTGAYNHTKLLPDLKAEQQRLKESGAQYSLLLMDLDLKEINKSHGRELGDKLLRTTILSIREALSPVDKIYRYGGAEFVICLPGKNTDDAEQVKEMLLQKMGEALLETAGESDTAFHIYYSIVKLDPDAYLEELLDRSARSTYTITL